jgi:excinuclease ABC subunit A
VDTRITKRTTLRDGAPGAKEHLFNAKFACPVCSYSISELEPRLFSFNSPVGRLPGCDGMGTHGVL